MDDVTEIFSDSDTEFSETLRMGLRGTAVNISLLTTRDLQGRCHGLTVTSAVPFSTRVPSMIVAVSHAASAFPAIRESGMYCLNQITSKDIELLDRFSRSDKRASRFANGDWRAGIRGLPFLATATASFFCTVTSAQTHEDQTVFIGRIEGIRLADCDGFAESDPLIWINGGPAKLAGRAFA